MTNLHAVTPSLLALSLLAGCNSATAPKSGQSVSFRLATATPLAVATGALSITSFRLVVGGSALGSGDQFGCVDCQAAGPEAQAVPEIVSIPLDGTPVQLRTEQVQPGTYTMMEIEIVVPTATVLAVTPGWSGQHTIVIAGTYNGRPFEFGLPIEGTVRQRLATALVVGTGGTPASVQVTITLPVAAWFAGVGATLDPTDAAQRAMIEANARKSFVPLELLRQAGIRMLCIYGTQEKESLCRDPQESLMTRVAKNGADHFGGDHPALATQILAQLFAPE